MILPTADQILLIGAIDRGVPNRERIVFRPAEPINLLQFVVCLALREPAGMVRPINDRVFWFPDMVVEPPCWIVLYTGPGTARTTTLPPSSQPAYTFHWGFPYTALNDPAVVPVILGLGSIVIPTLLAGEQALPAKPQIALPPKS